MQRCSPSTLLGVNTARAIANAAEFRPLIVENHTGYPIWIAVYKIRQQLIGCGKRCVQEAVRLSEPVLFDAQDTKRMDVLYYNFKQGISSTDIVDPRIKIVLVGQVASPGRARLPTRFNCNEFYSSTYSIFSQDLNMVKLSYGYRVLVLTFEKNAFTFREDTSTTVKNGGSDGVQVFCNAETSLVENESIIHYHIQRVDAIRLETRKQHYNYQAEVFRSLPVEHQTDELYNALYREYEMLTQDQNRTVNDWNEGNVYNRDDIVAAGTLVFVSLVDNNFKSPLTTSKYWKIIDPSDETNVDSNSPESTISAARWDAMGTTSLEASWDAKHVYQPGDLVTFTDGVTYKNSSVNNRGNPPNIFHTVVNMKYAEPQGDATETPESPLHKYLRWLQMSHVNRAKYKSWENIPDAQETQTQTRLGGDAKTRELEHIYKQIKRRYMKKVKRGGGK